MRCDGGSGSSSTGSSSNAPPRRDEAAGPRAAPRGSKGAHIIHLLHKGLVGLRARRRQHAVRAVAEASPLRGEVDRQDLGGGGGGGGEGAGPGARSSCNLVLHAALVAGQTQQAMRAPSLPSCSHRSKIAHVHPQAEP